MERLVIKDGKGNLYFYDTERGVKLESYEVQPLQRREVLERLYKYEDTGLTPEEIISIANELKEYKQLGLSPKRLSEHVAFCHRYHELFGAIDFSRLMELAERDTAKEAIITGHNQAIGCKVGECPKCSTMARDYMNFCSECGQRLKWED